VRRLVQPVEIEALACARDCVVHASLQLEPKDQAVERDSPFAAHRVLVQSLPIVEVDAVSQPESRQQVVAVEVAGCDQGRRRRMLLARQPAKLGEVEPGVGQVEADRIAVALQPSFAERGAERRERPAERGARALGVRVGPEQVRDNSARVGVAGHREVREHRRRLARVDRQRFPVHLDARCSEK
jgi:hypothetical protein